MSNVVTEFDSKGVYRKVPYTIFIMSFTMDNSMTHFFKIAVLSNCCLSPWSASIGISLPWKYVVSCFSITSHDFFVFAKIKTLPSSTLQNNNSNQRMFSFYDIRPLYGYNTEQRWQDVSMKSNRIFSKLPVAVNVDTAI